MGLVDFEISRRKLSNTPTEFSPEYLPILNYVRERMGHSNIKSTMRYLSYHDRMKILRAVNTDFESHLIGKGF